MAGKQAEKRPPSTTSRDLSKRAAQAQMDATEQAQAAGFDSSLASPPGGPREFIVFEADQVYPEYSIIYDLMDADL